MYEEVACNLFNLNLCFPKQNAMVDGVRLQGLPCQHTYVNVNVIDDFGGNQEIGEKSFSKSKAN